MPYTYYNPNPVKNNTEDCAIRAVAKVLDISWEDSFIKLAGIAFSMGQTMNYNAVWSAVLRQNGFYKEIIPNTCPDCYTARDFCRDHNKGTYVLAFSNHVSAVIDGVIYDTVDTGDEIPMFYWEKRKENMNATS